MSGSGTSAGLTLPADAVAPVRHPDATAPGELLGENGRPEEIQAVMSDPELIRRVRAFEVKP